jgi:hypothetical protein
MAVREIMRRREMSALAATLVSMPVWLIVAFSLKILVLG